MSAQTRREKSNRTTSIIAVLILCSYLFGDFYRDGFQKYVVEAFQIPSTSMIPTPFSGNGSMKPTLICGDRLFVRKSCKYTPKRGDVIVLKSPNDPSVPWVKRVAALPDETVEIAYEQLFINGRKVRYRPIESIRHFNKGFGLDEPYRVPTDHIFVIGDNAADSYDSRLFGSIPLSDMIGKAYEIFWPLDRVGPVE
jgi:signal peptidase I